MRDDIRWTVSIKAGGINSYTNIQKDRAFQKRFSTNTIKGKGTQKHMDCFKKMPKLSSMSKKSAWRDCHTVHSSLYGARFLFVKKKAPFAVDVVVNADVWAIVDTINSSIYRVTLLFFCCSCSG